MDNNHKKIIENTAFTLFGAFTASASELHPKLNIIIKDERNLVSDLENVVISAIETLLQEKNKQSRKIKGYDFGFFLGFVQSQLNSIWVAEYITKQSNAYKDYLICKSLLDYLRFDTETGYKINNIFEEFFKLNINIESIDTNIENIITGKYDIDKINSENQYLEKNTPIFNYIENQLNKHIIEYIEIEKVDVLPKLEKYFDTSFVEELINKSI